MESVWEVLGLDMIARIGPGGVGEVWAERAVVALVAGVPTHEAEQFTRVVSEQTCGTAL